MFCSASNAGGALCCRLLQQELRPAPAVSVNNTSLATSGRAADALSSDARPLRAVTTSQPSATSAACSLSDVARSALASRTVSIRDLPPTACPPPPSGDRRPERRVHLLRDRLDGLDTVAEARLAIGHHRDDIGASRRQAAHSRRCGTTTRRRGSSSSRLLDKAPLSPRAGESGVRRGEALPQAPLLLAGACGAAPGVPAGATGGRPCLPPPGKPP